ncbi:RecQ family ATP-dependent DNA helicase [Phormidium sp. CCY1219]|uniref:RecQ family ATP-dependent DNA helicase n=1 Tax=Phormidium sp. CCY1219 TaxID=2886104 RepID=UPI002D1F96F6|nr:ATP-dependent DNA helicase RecQ [Phormidium sp. CCY1219]MEB3827221.1 ATP-dependent DNA helicase [Phormidium sp. CCY1219]
MNCDRNLSWNDVREAFRQIWGYADFRPPQGEIVQTLLQGKDALIVLPTGGGKSICFQLPAILQTGITLVVSPLVALMENQVQELHQRQLSAALLHGEQDKQQRRKTLAAIERNQLRLLYLSPETLLSPPVWERLSQPELPINGLILDEAHCLVQWGDTFRPAYRRLGAVRPALLQSKPAGTKMAIAAFTATADSAAQQTIKKVLQLQQPQLFLNNPYRPNLDLQIKIAWTPKHRWQQLIQVIKSQRSQAGLVYVRTRKDAEKLAARLGKEGFSNRAYHAGLSARERREIESAWMSDRLQFVVCTCAFGMGVNKPNVRWVVHFQTPALLSEYIQEVGRAGRDGKPAIALSLVSECTGFLDPGDKQRREFFATQQRSQYQRARQLAKKLPPQGNIAAVTRKYKNGAIALSLLHSTGQLQWRDPFHYIISGHNFPATLENENATKQMAQFLFTRHCRWQFLLAAFGFSDAAKNMRCGHCDNCRKKR